MPHLQEAAGQSGLSPTLPLKNQLSYIQVRKNLKRTEDLNIAKKEIYLEACTVQSFDLMHLMLAIGADVNWRTDILGWSGLHFAASTNNYLMLELLLKQPS